ncbi:MAG: ABC transporter ATP-binding protein [Bacillota bacterium]
MLTVKDLHVSHGRINVIKGVSLKVKKGEMVALIGANGAGKSTLLGTIAGIHRPQAGVISLEQEAIRENKAHAVVRKGISLVPERREVFDALSVHDNLLLGAYHRYTKSKAGISGDVERVMEIFPVLKERMHQLAGTLSGGEQQMLAIGRGLMANPKVLLLDEPSVGLAPLIVKEIFDILVNLKQQGTTILMVEQNARAALKISDRAYVLERGEIVHEGEAQRLLHDPRIQASYLGQKQQLKIS